MSFVLVFHASLFVFGEGGLKLNESYNQPDVCIQIRSFKKQICKITELLRAFSSVNGCV